MKSAFWEKRTVIYENIIELDEVELKKYQECLLEIGKDVIHFFEKEKINYSLSGGSILGAVRHHGFIPWDDDIDLNVTRESYNKMLEKFEEALGDKYYLQTPLNCPELGLLVTQIRKKGTTARRKYDWNIEKCGISIDIYVVENVFDNSILRFFQKNISMFLSFQVSAIRACNNRKIPKQLLQLENRKLNYTKLKMVMGRIAGIIPLEKWIQWCEYWFSLCKDNSTRLVSIPTGRKHFSGEIYERKEMCAYRKAEFETEYFNIPIHAEKYLQEFYGDYMTIPPKEKQERHLFLELKY